jgi:hypothetical protein
MKNTMAAAMILAVACMILRSQCHAKEFKMNDTDHLHILWTNGDPITADKMVFMYASNGLKQGWWKHVTVIIWGSPAKLVGENADIRSKIREVLAAGVKFSACKACSDQLGVTDKLESLGIEVKYWGQPLTELIRSGKLLLSI